MLGYVSFHPSESLVNSEDTRSGRTSTHDFFHDYLIIYRSVNMNTLEVYAENQINSPEDNAIYTGRGGAV
jgi:hypothetical protein